MTVNGAVALILRYFTEFGTFRGALHKNGRRYTDIILQQKCSSKNLVFSNISFMAIFAGDDPQ